MIFGTATPFKSTGNEQLDTIQFSSDLLEGLYFFGSIFGSTPGILTTFLKSGSYGANLFILTIGSLDFIRNIIIASFQTLASGVYLGFSHPVEFHPDIKPVCESKTKQCRINPSIFGSQRSPCFNITDCSDKEICIRNSPWNFLFNQDTSNQIECPDKKGVCGFDQFGQPSKGWLLQQDYQQTGLFSCQCLPYNTYYPNHCSVGVCGCKSDIHCSNGMKCYEGECRCFNHDHCENGLKCLAESVRDTVSFPHKPGRCSCIVGDDSTCNNAGSCVSQNGDYSPTYDRETNSRVIPGRCECWNNIDVWGKSCDFDNVTVVNCNNNGVPVCPLTPGLPLAYTANGTGIVIGSVCPSYNPSTFNSLSSQFKNALLNRGYNSDRSAFACQCKPGYTSDITPVGGTKSSCATKTRCFGDINTIDIPGTSKCECIEESDTYPIASANEITMECKSGCSAYKCSGHGTCYYNSNKNPRKPPIIGPDRSWDIQYTNDCQCSPGWRTSEPLIPGKFEAIAEEAFGVQPLCDQPYDELADKICGEGGIEYTSRECICIPDFSEVAPGYGSLSLANTKYRTDSETGLCARQCPMLDSFFWNKTSEERLWSNDFSIQVCGGPARGDCVNSANFTSSKVCQCKNGYSGYACQNPICPRLNGNGAMCSGRGECHEQSGRCLCDENYGGLACEIRFSSCDQGQPIKSNPDLADIQFTNDFDY